MKKTLLLATALTCFAGASMAQEVKTTTVQYQVPKCTNCRTTTTVSTTYPEPEPVCDTCQQPVVAKPVLLKKTQQKTLKVDCHDNHELGIRNPLFTLKEGQFSFQTLGGLFKEPKRKLDSYDAGGNRNFQMENVGWQWADRLAYGITDKWSVQIFGGHKFSRPKTSQYRFAQEDPYSPGYQVGTGIPHSNGYDLAGGTYYHLLDFCHFDAIVGLEGGWHREKSKQGKNVKRINGWSIGPAATIGANVGWFTPYVSGSYMFTHTHDYKTKESEKKEWIDDEVYTITPGIYIQPSKWYAFDLNINKVEHKAGQWNAGVDFYPYKNVSVGAQFNARRPFEHPMQMFGVSADAKIVF